MTDRMEKALAALVACPTHEEAARQAGITSRTLRNYLQDPEFSARYAEECRDILTNATTSLQKSMTGAVLTLKGISDDVDISPFARVQAARALLDSNVKMIETGAIYERMTALQEPLHVTIDYGDALEVLEDDQRTACDLDSERPAETHPDPVEPGGEICSLAGPPVDRRPEPPKSRNLI